MRSLFYFIAAILYKNKESCHEKWREKNLYYSKKIILEIFGIKRNIVVLDLVVLV